MRFEWTREGIEITKEETQVALSVQAWLVHGPILAGQISTVLTLATVTPDYMNKDASPTWMMSLLMIK